MNGPRQGTQVWRYTALDANAINIEPAVTAQGVYFGSWGIIRTHGAAKADWDKFDGKMFGLDPRTGKELWATRVADKGNASHVGASVRTEQGSGTALFILGDRSAAVSSGRSLVPVGQKLILLPAPSTVQGGSFWVPVDFLTKVLPELSPQKVTYRADARLRCQRPLEDLVAEVAVAVRRGIDPAEARVLVADDDVALRAVRRVQHLQRVVAVDVHVRDGDAGQRPHHGQPRLLQQLAPRAILDGLARVERPAGQIPASDGLADGALEDEDLGVALREDGGRQAIRR